MTTAITATATITTTTTTITVDNNNSEVLNAISFINTTSIIGNTTVII